MNRRIMDGKHNLLIMRTPMAGIRIMDARRVALHSLVELKIEWPLPKVRISSPMTPVPACRLKYFDNCKPSFRETSTHCTFSKAEPIVVPRNRLVNPESTLRTKIAWLLELYRNRT
jgi:hypothetical protein